MTAYGKGTDPAKQLTDEGKPNYIAQGEFGATYEGIDNRYNSGASSYTVQSGDTLAGIARTLWGDASLWWKLADVNGLAAQGPDSRLTEGQSLSIPGHVSGVHNTAQTHKPYDPTEVVGDTTPSMPAPPVDEGGGCGILGKIIMIVVAVAVTAVTGGAGGAVSNFWGGLLGQGSAAAAAATGATAAAAGSVASQAVGVAIGAQSKFSWKNVALAAVSGGVSGGLGKLDFTGSEDLHSLGNTVIRSALGNTISQGIGVATGLQKSFDWKSVAGAAVGAGVGWGVGQALGTSGNTLAGAGIRSFAAGAATALVRGGKISIAQVAVDAFGSALGDGLGDTLRAGLGQSQGNSPAFMGGGAGGAVGSSGNGYYEADNGPDWGTGAVAGQPTLTAGDFARMDRASEEVWAAQGGAWEQPGTTATDRAFLEAFQNPGALASAGEGVLMAAGPGYSGGVELRDRLTLHSREDNSLFEEASALAANAMQADNRRAAWMQTQAQAASAQYAQGYGDVRDTSPAAGLLVNPETGLADFRYTSQTLNSQADGAHRSEIGGSDGITGPSIGSLSANSGTGSYDNPRTWIGNEVIVRERAETMLPEDQRRFELESRNRNEPIEPTTGSALADEAIQRAAGTVLGGADIVHGGVQFATDKVWAIGNAVTGGWLANNVPAAQAATARNIELGNSLLNLPGQISRGALRAVTGNWHGAAQSASNALQLNQIQAANARGDYLSAQVMATQSAINVAGLAMGGVGAARAGLGMAAVQDARVGAQLAAQDAAANLSAPRLLNSQFGGVRIGNAADAKAPHNAGRGAPAYDKWVNDKEHTVYSNLDGSVVYVRNDGVAVTYTKAADGNAYPDFTPHVKPGHTVELDQPFTRGLADYRAANEKAGLSEWGSKAPEGYRWHHHEDMKRMQLVPVDIHNDFKHYGGVSNTNRR